MFHFNLDKVLNYRSRQVETEALKLREIVKRRDDLLNKRRDIELACSRVVEAESGRGVGELDIMRFLNYSNWLTQQHEFIRRCEIQAREVQVIIENQRQVLLRRKHDESVLLKLKQRHRDAWAVEEARRETKQMDETGARAFGRKIIAQAVEGVPRA